MFQSSSKQVNHINNIKKEQVDATLGMQGGEPENPFQIVHRDMSSVIEDFQQEKVPTNLGQSMEDD